jgi:large subunit ribosomal protein L35
MPKLKTNKSAAKRFKRTAKGHFKHRSSFRNHILTKKTAGRKRHLAGLMVAHESDEKNIQRLLPNSR